MECITITPSKLRGCIKVPPSKSIAHRASICGGLADGVSLISNIDYSDDLNASIRCMEALGSHTERGQGCLLISGKTFMAGKKADSAILLDCGESGTTLRMVLPLALTRRNNLIFTGRGSLGKRPLDPYYEIFDNLGIEYTYDKDRLNLKVNGVLKPGEYKLKGDISSQFISGLIMALPLLDGDSRIVLTTNLESKGYVDLTMDMLSKFGVYIDNQNYSEFIIKGNQSLNPQNIRIEGDYSQAAFFLSAGALGSNIECEGLSIDSLQGDKAILDILQKIGCRIENYKSCIKAYSSGTSGTIIDGSQIPDILPVLAVVASLSKGTTKIINAGRLRIKECDRLRAMHDELEKLGADIKELDDTLLINGKEYLEGGIVDSWNDHRVAMALAIASTRCKRRVTITGSEAVKKSYPGFWDDFKKLGGIIN